MREMRIDELVLVSGGEDMPDYPVYADGPFDGGTSGSGGTVQPGTDPGGHRNAK